MEQGGLNPSLKLQYQEFERLTMTTILLNSIDEIDTWTDALAIIALQIPAEDSSVALSLVDDMMIDIGHRDGRTILETGNAQLARIIRTDRIGIAINIRVIRYLTQHIRLVGTDAAIRTDIESTCFVIDGLTSDAVAEQW